MNERPDASRDVSPHTGITGEDGTRHEKRSTIGIGKRIGLYGCGLLLLGLVVIAAVIFLTGVYVPFEGTEGVGP